MSDTSPLRALNYLGRLDLIPSLFDDVLVPPAVALELLRRTRVFAPLDATRIPRVSVRVPTRADLVARFRQQLDPGESEALALALALEVGASAVLIDEEKGRAVARSAGLVPVGVLGMLIRGKRLGLVPSVGPLMGRLEAEIEFRISPELRRFVLGQVREGTE